MKEPQIDKSALIAPGAVVIGDVKLAENVNVWYNAVIRGDVESIEIGEGTTVQDNCVLHVSCGIPLKIGRRVTIGHNAIVHGCTVGDGTLIGMGSIIMDGAVVGSGCIVAAGAIVTEGMVVPDGSLVMGIPARVRRETTEEEREFHLGVAGRYIDEAREAFPNK